MLTNIKGVELIPVLEIQRRLFILHRFHYGTVRIRIRYILGQYDRLSERRRERPKLLRPTNNISQIPLPFHHRLTPTEDSRLHWRLCIGDYIHCRWFFNAGSQNADVPLIKRVIVLTGVLN